MEPSSKGVDCDIEGHFVHMKPLWSLAGTVLFASHRGKTTNPSAEDRQPMDERTVLPVPVIKQTSFLSLRSPPGFIFTNNHMTLASTLRYDPNVKDDRGHLVAQFVTRRSL